MKKTIEQFVNKYENLSIEELIELEKGKADLVDEAADALKKVLAERKQGVIEVKTKLSQPQPKPSRAALWANFLAMALGLSFANNYHIGATLADKLDSAFAASCVMGVTTGLCAALGWWMSKHIVSLIKAHRISEGRKKFLIWLLLPIYLIAYFMLFVTIPTSNSLVSP